MAFKTSSATDVSPFPPPAPFERRAPILSPDGYIRLQFACLAGLHLVHLYSDSDPDFLQELKAQTVSARIAGFCEWQSKTEPTVSLGWGWFIHSQSDRMMLAPDPVRSNVMLIDAQGYDLGQRQTANLFYAWLGEFEWRSTVGGFLNHSFSAC